MNTKRFGLYYILSLLGVVLASVYPLYMGVKVVYEMAVNGSVPKEEFPKYIIPYTPICLAVIVGVALMPLAMKWAKKWALPAASGVSLAAFFAAELLLESRIIVTADVLTTLESWQMYMCYVPPEFFETRKWTAIDVLMGEYSPTFKIHFYLISVLLILAVLGCVYGFGKVVRSGDKTRVPALTVQSVCTAAFLGMCIWACFTAFYRTGELLVSPLSAVLMCAFFLLLGVVAGLYVGSLLHRRRPLLSVVLPSVTAAAVTLAMYVGEMCLLSGHVYRFGEGFFFDGLPAVVLAPVDILVIIAAGAVCGAIRLALSKSRKAPQDI